MSIFGSRPASREQRSLFGEILDWMLAPLLLLWPMSVALTWLVAENIANRPFDRALNETTRTLAHQVEATPDPVRVELPVPPEDEPREAGIVKLRDGEIHNEGIRIAYMWVQATGGSDDALALVQVAETLNKRSHLATEIIKGVILPQFVILPVAVLLVWLALARGLAPLTELQDRIRRRRSDDLSAIDEGEAPEEVAPLVRSINGLLDRLDQSIKTQKHFLADAAHQLKTPLAGLRMQAELAQREIDAGQRDPQELKRSLRQIARSSQRAAHLVNQLLALARAENQGQARRLHDVSLAKMATEVVQDFVPRSMEKQIDLGYEGPGAGNGHGKVLVRGNGLLLKELIRNLVDNALLYTPSKGTVTVRVVDDPFGQVGVLQVEDSGPGIPESEREVVFQPFYRALGTGVDGSGLGLAIVREIAQQHDATVTIEDAHEGPAGLAPEGGRGTRVTVRFVIPPDLREPGPPVVAEQEAQA